MLLFLLIINKGYAQNKEKELAERYRIQSVPTLIIFKKGKQLWRQSGIISANALIKLLKDYQ